jgi:hypothetical protein
MYGKSYAHVSSFVQSKRSLSLFQERLQEEEYAGVEALANGKVPRRGVDSEGVRIDEPFPILMEQATIAHFITGLHSIPQDTMSIRFQ